MEHKVATNPWHIEQIGQGQINTQGKSFCLRTVAGGGHLWTSSSPNPCSKRTQLEQVAQARVQSGFVCLRGWRPHNLAGKSVPTVNHPYNKNKVFCVFEQFLVFRFVPTHKWWKVGSSLLVCSQTNRFMGLKLLQ